MRTCATCKCEKHEDNFRKDKTIKSGYRSYCLECEKIRIRNNARKRYHTKRKYYNEENAKEISDKYKVWRLKNVKKISARVKYKYHNDINFRIKHILRSRIQKAVKLNCRKTSSSELLGCSIADYRIYLESKFKEGMSWENYGRKNGCWVIDHIIPCNSFDLMDTEQQKLCFHFTNTQPLWWYDNLKKYNKIL